LLDRADAIADGNAVLLAAAAQGIAARCRAR